MSYAEVVATGVPQSEEEARAPHVPEIIPTDQSVDSLIDITTGVAVVPSDYKEQEVKTETQARRLDLEAEQAEQEAQKATNPERAEKKEEKKEEKEEKKKGDENKEKEKCCKSYIKNPIIQANGLVFAIATIAVGFGAYRKHQVGQLTCKLVGMWAAGFTAFLGVDYLISAYLWKKNPYCQQKK